MVNITKYCTTEFSEYCFHSFLVALRSRFRTVCGIDTSNVITGLSVPRYKWNTVININEQIKVYTLTRSGFLF